MRSTAFNYTCLEDIVRRADELGVHIPLSADLEILRKPLQAGSLSFANRLAIQPMEGCDGTAAGEPGELTRRRYGRYARSGAALIWLEAVAVDPVGRANPRQLCISEETADSFARLISDIKEACIRENGFEPVVIMQATHSGRYSKPCGRPAPWIAYHNPLHEKTPIADDRIITDDALKALEAAYGKAAGLARQVGFNGIDVKCCHGYLMNELLSAYTRPGAYGGSFENRIRCYTNSIRAARTAAGEGFTVTSRLNIYDGFPYPYGFGVSPAGGMEPDYDEPLRLIEILHRDLGVGLLDITMGNPYQNPHVNRPSVRYGYEAEEHPLAGVARMYAGTKAVRDRFPDLALLSSAASFLRQFSGNLAAGALEEGCCSMAGFGRLSFAYPDFARDLLQKGALEEKKCCITCGKCTELMRAGSMAGCVVRDQEVYLPLYRRDVQGIPQKEDN